MRRIMDEIKRLRLPFLFFLPFLLILAAGCVTDLDPRMSSSTFEYSISIQSDNVIKNATFIIPLPVKNGTPVLGNEILNVKDFQKEGIDIEFIKKPSDLDLITSTNIEYYTPCFVVIHGDYLVPDKTTHKIYQMEKSVRIVPSKPDFSLINTLYPIGNESLIVPKYNFTWKSPQIGEVQNTNIRYTPQSIPEKTAIFSQYNTSDKTRVSVFFSLQGRNTWKQGYDAWVGNTYSEFFSRHYTGPQNGWFLINGEMQLLDGIYPNYDHPEWQKALNGSETIE